MLLILINISHSSEQIQHKQNLFKVQVDSSYDTEILRHKISVISMKCFFFTGAGNGNYRRIIFYITICLFRIKKLLFTSKFKMISNILLFLKKKKLNKTFNNIFVMIKLFKIL